jgi:hypothetical protein
MTVHWEVDGKCHVGKIVSVDDNDFKNPNIRVTSSTRIDAMDTLYEMNWFMTREGSPPRPKNDRDFPG